MYKEFKYLAFIILFFTGLVCVDANQNPVTSQYFMSKFIINPARAGAYGNSIINMTAREQWMGIKGAPRTYLLSYQSRLLKNSHIGNARSARKRYRSRRAMDGRMGYGAMIYTDQSGILNNTGVMGSYAYHIPFSRSQLSLGLSVSVMQYSLDEENIVLHDENDELVNESGGASYVPDASFGVYFSDRKSYYVGLSSSNLTESSLVLGEKNFEETKKLRQYVLFGGYKFQLNRDYSIEPSLLFKTFESLNSQTDINLRGIYMDSYWVGLSYRTGTFGINENTLPGGAFVVLLGVAVDRFDIGYAFDYSLNSLQKHTFGSHELNVSIRFGDNSRRFRWLDRY